MTSVFISWSGPRGMALGKALNEWLPKLIQEVEPFYSPDIEKGAPWLSRITGELAETSLGIVIVTPESARAPWLNYEAGALAKNQGIALVYTALLGLSNSEVKGPLAEFQSTALPVADDVFKLLCSINMQGLRPLPESRLRGLFDLLWPELEQEITAIERQPVDVSRGPQRSEIDLLSEILDRVRAIERRTAPVINIKGGSTSPTTFFDHLPGFDADVLARDPEALRMLGVTVTKRQGVVDSQTGNPVSIQEISHRLARLRALLAASDAESAEDGATRSE